jgi:hypothetical protein
MKRLTRILACTLITASASVPLTSAVAKDLAIPESAAHGAIIDHHPGPFRPVVLDVAIDGRTWRLDHGLSPDADRNPFDPFDPAKLIQMKRGDTFIVEGKIFPGGTILEGGDFGAPGGFTPDADGSIGKWICRGWFNFDFTDIANGAVPHVTTTQVFIFNNGDQLWTDGLEGGTTTTRLVTGATGKLRGLQGQVVQKGIGVNSADQSQHFNLRFRFDLTR